MNCSVYKVGLYCWLSLDDGSSLYFTSEAQQRIRGINNKNNRTNSIFANRLTYAY